MILEYLFLNEKLKEDILKYKNKSLNINIKEIKDSVSWIAEFTSDDEDEQSALILSEINEDIIKNFDCITLTNESAFYYNKKLYPLINKFERKLRKTLYLASNLSNDPSDSEIIHDIEKMDFGELFEILFTDDEFIKKVKIKINSKSWRYNKSEIMDDLVGIEERTLWDTLLGAKIAPTLRESFIIIKRYRNYIMHAHNITVEDYEKTKKIFLITNQELDNAINDIMNNNVGKLYKNTIQDFSRSLKDAINATKFINPINQQLQELATAIKFTNDMSPISEQFKELAAATKFTSDMGSISEQFKELAAATKFTSDMSPISEQFKKLAATTKVINDIRPISEQLKGMDDNE